MPQTFSPGMEGGGGGGSHTNRAGMLFVPLAKGLKCRVLVPFHADTIIVTTILDKISWKSWCQRAIINRLSPLPLQCWPKQQRQANNILVLEGRGGGVSLFCPRCKVVVTDDQQKILYYGEWRLFRWLLSNYQNIHNSQGENHLMIIDIQAALEIM